MTQNAKQETVLVTAATGKTGTRVTRRLDEKGVRVRAGSRKGAGANGVAFDWEAPETWAPALAGATAAYVAYYPDLAAPGAVEAMRTFGREAAAAGVGRLVALSGRGEPQAVAAESALGESGVGLTVVRASFFAQNFSEGPMAEGVANGEILFPAGDTAEPFIDADDLADVLVTVLTEDRHAGRVHELTGPRLLTFAEVAAEISRVSGRQVRYVPVSCADYSGAVQEMGYPEADAVWLAELFTTLMDGHNASTTDGVQEVLGREARDFSDFARDIWGG
ncbi:NmrA family NAD(P)-binding protein [Streptomyces sp. NPDC051018]|uniref:NmrA family NAD(P)-binding protein n=1 Tax=Streptomyces sp. NPDC051018 TaxID=3365639 RepID=UPI0037BA4DE0